MTLALALLCLPTADFAVSIQPAAVGQPVRIAVLAPQEMSEDGSPNPFTDRRLTVTFRHDGQSFSVPGFFAADGDAAESGATAGRVWRATFCPPAAGEWTYTADWAEGDDVATDADAVGRTIAEGELTVADAVENAGFYSTGPIAVDREAQRYRLGLSGDVWTKFGADSPENFLAFIDFDGTYRHDKKNDREGDTPLNTSTLHRFEPHAQDAREGDPTWRGGKGKNILGAVNYLADQGMNSVYFLTMNVTGDGKDVWPWTSHTERRRFDVSKLAQWDRVFGHMQRRGVAMHVVLQETENDQLLDDGDLGPDRKLYLREVVARFGYHPGVVWNIGEENTQTPEQVRAMAAYIRKIDPLGHPVKMHTFPNKMAEGYRPLLGEDTLDGVSLQVGNPKNVHAQTVQWLTESREAGRPWVAELDEIGPAKVGVKPDADDPRHDLVRREVLWPHLMAGGGGCEWYFGYKHAHHDLTAEDWRSRAEMWRQTRVAKEFVAGLPLAGMRSADGLVGEDGVHVLAGNETYVVYLKSVRDVSLDLSDADGEFTVRWLNPLKGGEPAAGTVGTIEGGGRASLGLPSGSAEGDWVCVVQKPE